MDALLRLVSLGGAARNAAKIKVRQPLAELRVSAGVATPSGGRSSGSPT